MRMSPREKRRIAQLYGATVEEIEQAERDAAHDLMVPLGKVLKRLLETIELAQVHEGDGQPKGKP